MDAGKISAHFPEGLRFPQLTKFSATKISAERTSFAPFAKTASRATETIRLVIELIPDNSKVEAGRDRHRIVATIEFDAQWRDKDSAAEIATFVGQYRGLFHFNSVMDTDIVKELMADKFYRDFLVAQVYPLAKNHMNGQLAVLGVNTSRKLGLDVEDTNFEPIKPVAKKPRRSKVSKQETSD